MIPHPLSGEYIIFKIEHAFIYSHLLTSYLYIILSLIIYIIIYRDVRFACIKASK